MSANPFAAIVGTDNISPIHNPDSLFQIWNKNDIYTGQAGQGKYIPKIGDEVHEINGRVISKFIVTNIGVDGIATLVAEAASLLSGDEDLLVGETGSDTYRVYINKAVTPHTLSVDARLKIYGSASQHCKLFRGTDITDTGTVIGRTYDQAWNPTGEDIGLELAGVNNATNTSIKCVRQAYTNFDLEDGEIVTAVIYNSQGSVISRRRLLVENTTFVRSTNASALTIDKIYLTSPFISNPSVNREILFPIGATLDSLNLKCVIRYSNGTETISAIDGTKIKVFGLEDIIATVTGEEFSVVVNYRLDAGETTYAAGQSQLSHISEIYTCRITSIDGAYALKLYCYPSWVSTASGYSLNWFLYNQDRSIKYNVTSNVQIDATYRPFNPKEYGVLQRLRVSLNLHSVDPTFANYIHVQVIDVILNKEGTERLDNWLIGYSTTQENRYGINTFIKALRKFTGQTIWQLDLTCGLTSQEEWLEKLYRKTLPQFNTNLEEFAPNPNFFAVIINGIRHEYALSQWLERVEMDIPTSFNSKTTYIEFFKRTFDGDMHLAIAGLPTYYINNAGEYI